MRSFTKIVAVRIILVTALALWVLYSINLQSDILVQAEPRNALHHVEKLIEEQQQQQQEQERSIFALHVGPSKTGTSYVQSLLERKTNKLAQDNYTYLGNNNGILNRNELFQCRSSTANNNDNDNACQVSPSFTSLLETSQEKGHHLIGSNEYLQGIPDKEMDALRLALNESSWVLHVIIAYRRFHEYLPSHYNQFYKYKRNSKNIPIGKHDHWPGDDRVVHKDYAIPTFLDFFMQENYHFNGNRWRGKYPARLAYERWSRVANEISIFRLDQPGDMPTNFVCQMIPGMDFFCSHLLATRNHDYIQQRKEEKKEQLKKTTNQQQEQQRANRNLSQDLDYDILAVAAYEKGWISPSYPRQGVVSAMEQFHKGLQKHNPEASKFFHICPPQTIIDTLYKKSLEHEQWVLSILEQQAKEPKIVTNDIILSPEQLAAFNASWVKSVNGEKFCSVDAEKTLEMPLWREFITSRFSAPS